MSRVKYETPFKAFRGKICKHSDIIYKKMGDTEFTSQICNPRTKPFTAEELARQQKFKTAAINTKTVMTDPDKLAAYTEAFIKQKKYRYLRPYIFAQEYHKL